MPNLTPELNSLLSSVTGDCYLGKDEEERIATVVRAQYTDCVQIGSIKEPYSIKEIKEMVNSGQYNAELLLQHALMHL